VTFTPSAGQTVTVSGVIADESGSGGTGASASQGKLLVQGGGTTRLTATNTFAGGSAISANSTLDLGAGGAGGTGTITFAGGSFGRLLLETAALPSGTKFSNTVSAFTTGDAIDLSGLTFKAGAAASIASNTLSVISNGITDTIALSAPGANLGLVAVQDAGTGTEVITNTFTVSTEAQLLADLTDVNTGGADAASNVGYAFNFLNAVPIVTGGETVNLLSGSSVTYKGTGFTTGGTTTIAAGTLIAGTIGALGSGALSIGPSGTAAANGFAQAIGDLAGSGVITLGTATLTEGTSNSSTFSGGISGTGAASLIKQGAGTLTLSGADTLPGGMTINAGGVVLGNSLALGGGGTVTFGAATGDLLEFHLTTVPTNTIAGFVQGQTLDLNMAGTTVTGASINTNTLQISLSAGGPINLTLSPAQSWVGANFNHATSGSDNFITEARFTPVVTASGTVSYDGGAPPVPADSGLTIVDNASTTLASAQVVIGGFVSGDTLTVGTPGALTPSFSNGTLTLTGTASVATYQTALESVAYSSSQADPSLGHTHTSRTLTWIVNDGVAVSNTGTSAVNVTCYGRGTRILTDRGEVAVEDLRAGNSVVTHNGSVRPIQWVGRRRVDLRRHPAPELARPIVIRANAIADGVPWRELRVSPDHALLVDGVLILARQLVNGASIEPDRQCNAVTYYHVELETHDLLLAEALPAESYLDTGNRGTFENGGAPLSLHPDLSTVRRGRSAGSCRPFVDDASRAEAIWRGLAERARRAGFAQPRYVETTTDPDLRVVIGERVFHPCIHTGGRYAFALPTFDGPAVLMSRRVSPCEARPWIDDRRCLGVALSRLISRRGGQVVTIPLDQPGTWRGWWAAEWDADSVWRWTSGDAELTLPGVGPAILETEVSSGLEYPTNEKLAAPASTRTGPKLSAA
jgi:autotransporter-associated beta strand protein